MKKLGKYTLGFALGVALICSVGCSNDDKGHDHDHDHDGHSHEHGDHDHDGHNHEHGDDDAEVHHKDGDDDGHNKDGSESAKAAAKAYALETCIVSDEKLGSMGKPIVRVHEGQEVKFCCDSCVPDFEKEPEKFLAKLAK